MVLKPYEQGLPAGSQTVGRLIVQRTSKMRLFQPSYGKGRTVIRPWSTIRKDAQGAPYEEPWRDNEGRFGTTHLVQDIVCEGWGKDTRFTCMAECADQSAWPQGSPLQIFISDMKKHPEWKKILFERENSFAPLSNPKPMGFIKGLLIENAGKNYRKNPIWGVLFMLKPSMREAYDALLNQPSNKEALATDKDPMGWNSKFLVGDPVGCAHGKVFEFDREDKFQDEEVQEVNTSGIGTSRSGADKAEIKNYACRLWPVAAKSNYEVPLDINKVAKWDEPFENVLWYLTAEQQITLCLIPGFGRSCREAVMYSFGGKGILPASYETGKVIVHGPQVAAPQTQARPKPVSAQPMDDIVNLDGDGGNVADEDGQSSAADESPFQEAPVSAPANVPTAATKAPEPETPAPGPTSQSIRDRLEQLRKLQQGQ